MAETPREASSEDEHDFEAFFCKATRLERPYNWQVRIAIDGLPEVLPVPTGLGKTEGAVLAWAWRRFRGLNEPQHLVYCLPMRSLVRQTAERLPGRRQFFLLYASGGEVAGHLAGNENAICCSWRWFRYGKRLGDFRGFKDGEREFDAAK
jgi:CRISPR/Cas system-associated endonuclease/helicase Cas3